MRSVFIDLSTVRFCTLDMLARFRRIELVRDYIDDTLKSYADYNASHGIPPADPSCNGRHLTNLEIFRAYLIRYLQTAVPIRRDMQLLVRQLQPSDTGVPLQLYFFTDTVVWAEYEAIQAEVFAHVFASVGWFDLRVFQRPAGSNVEELARSLPSEEEHQDDLNENDPQEHAHGVDRSV